MKLLSYLVVGCLLLSLPSCTKDVCNRTVTYTKATAVYENLDAPALTH